MFVLVLPACATPWDGSVPPCEGEDPDRCLVGSPDLDGVPRTWLEARPEGGTCEAGPWPLVLAFRRSGANAAGLRAAVDVDACTPLAGCEAPVTFCKTHGQGYRNHLPPDSVLPEVRAFLEGAAGG